MPLAFGPISRRPISRLNDLPLIAVVTTAAQAVVLIYTLELYPITGSAVFVATEQYNTFPSDSLPNQPFNGTLEKALRYRRSIVDGSGFGGMSSGFGEGEINNASGEYDGVNFANARAVFKMAQRGVSYDQAITLYDGIVESSFFDEELIRVQLQDDNKRLEIPAQPSLYGGTGGIDGDANVKGKRKPLSLSICRNVSAPLIDAVNLIYQYHDGPVAAFVPDGNIGVYDRGIALTINATPDYANYAALVAAVVTPGRYATCVALGILKLGAKPDGQVTVTLIGAISNGLVAGKPTGTYMYDTASLVHYLITRSSANIVVDTGSILTVAAAQSAAVGYWIGPDDNKTLRQAINELMGGIGGWAGFRRDRTFEIGIFGLPSGQPSGDYSKLDWFNLTRVDLPDGIEPPPWRVRTAYQNNFTIQPEIDATVDASTQTLRKDPYSIAVSDDTVTSDAILDLWPNAQDPEVINSWFLFESHATAEANRQLVLRGGAARSLYRATLSSDAFAMAMCGVMKITDERWEPAGKSLTVVEIEDNLDQGEVVIEGLG